MRKPGLYNVKPNEDYCTWEIDLDSLAKNAVIQVSEGCRAIYYVNGKFVKAYTANTDDYPLVVNSRKVTKTGEESVVGVSYRQVFTILWGLGDVPYKDAESGINTKVGMHGEFKFTVAAYDRLLATFGKKTISPSDIKDYLVAKLKEILFSIISTEISGKKFNDITSLQMKISNRISAHWEDELEKLGLKLGTIALSQVKFDDDFVDRINREEYEPQKKGNPLEEYVKDHEAQEALKNIVKESQITCPVCGKMLSADAKFCDKCGAPVDNN